MRWTMVVLAALLLLSAGCAANRSALDGEEPGTAPSRLAVENDEAIKTGVDASAQNDTTAGWSVPPGQDRPGRPDGANSGSPLGGVYSASGDSGDLTAGDPDSEGGRPGNGFRPLTGAADRGSEGSTAGSGSTPGDRARPGAAGGLSRGAARGNPLIAGAVPATDIDRPNGGVERHKKPLVKPLVPAFPVRVRQERLNALRPVRFGFDSYVLNDGALALLTANAEWIKANPGVTVRVEGHADERGTAEYNMALGERRAKKVREALIRMGVDPANLITVSYGEEMPIDTASNPRAWSLNRRAEFSPPENRAVSANTRLPGSGG